jgi:transposase
MVTLEELVPPDHLLRLIDRHIPFNFIRDATAHLYCADNGRPAVDPVQLFKMLFIGYLFGIRSERALVREIQVNVAYRWFLGLGLTDRVIGASTFSQNRRRRFSGSDIEQTIGYRRPNHREGCFYKRDYVYDHVRDVYACPNGQLLPYRTTNRQGYREYASSPTQCAHCPTKGQCTQSANGVKVVIRHVWEDHKEAVDAHRLTETGRRLYKRRKETVERSFADAKELHGHRYARFRGLAKVRAQALLAGACQNMKKMARLLARAAARLLRALQPARTAIGLFQSRLSDLAGGWLLRPPFQHV